MIKPLTKKQWLKRIKLHNAKPSYNNRFSRIPTDHLEAVDKPFPAGPKPPRKTN